MLEQQKQSTPRSASTPAREAAREISRRQIHAHATEDRRSRIEADRDLSDRIRWAMQAVRG